MNIQIFGQKKCKETKKAERFFKERGIKVQSIDILQKGLSKGELKSVLQSIGSVDKIINEKNKNYHLIAYIYDDAKVDKLLEDPSFYKTPIVRNGKAATIGNAPEVWKGWCV